jgi:protein phosphatase
VRTLNEDAYLERPDIGLWLVADGMGGHDAGDLASQMVVASINGAGAHDRMSAFVNEVEERLLEVNGRLVDIAQAGSKKATVGSTVVALLALGGFGVCIWAGDSRAYLYRGGRLHTITQDHSEVERLIEEGLLLRVDAQSHPDSNVITRAVGAARQLYLDLEVRELQNHDCYLLCSDGLYKELTEADIAEVFADGDCRSACGALIDMAKAKGGHDNITAVIVRFERSG